MPLFRRHLYSRPLNIGKGHCACDMAWQGLQQATLEAAHANGLIAPCSTLRTGTLSALEPLSTYVQDWHLPASNHAVCTDQTLRQVVFAVMPVLSDPTIRPQLCLQPTGQQVIALQLPAPVPGPARSFAWPRWTLHQAQRRCQTVHPPGACSRWYQPASRPHESPACLPFLW